MTVLDMRLGGTTYQPSANPMDQASHSASPDHHNVGKEAEHAILVIAVIMGAIYALKILGRVVKRAK
jgi:hypothetical protein